MGISMSKKDFEKLKRKQADMRGIEYRKLQGTHTDVTMRDELPSLEERIGKLEKEMRSVQASIRMLKRQSGKAYARSFDNEHRLNALWERFEAWESEGK